MSGSEPQAQHDPRPLIVHVVYRFAVGGLENGVVNLINRLPAARWRHAVVSLTDVDPAFAARLVQPDVPCIALHKPPGQGFKQWPQLWRLLRQLRPAIVHTRNLAALEAQLPAWLAGVRGRVHGEHGRDVDDVDGSNRRHVWARRLYQPLVQRTIALSRDLAGYLQDTVGVPPARLVQIYNGVDTQRFQPAPGGRAAVSGCPFTDPGLFVVGTVGRMAAIKAQTDLARAFVLALQRQPALRSRLRLVLVGDGPLRADCQAILAAGNATDLAWLPGERADVPDVMRGLDCFALPSLAEGISNTILEAMATGLPVLATAVGGNADLVVDGDTGFVTPAADVALLADNMVGLARNPQQAQRMGQAGRQRVEQHFSLPAMVAAYAAVYDSLLARRPSQNTIRS